MMTFFATTLLLAVILFVGVFALLDRGQQQPLLGEKEADNVGFVESGRVRASHATAHVWLLVPSFIHNSSFIFLPSESSTKRQLFRLQLETFAQEEEDDDGDESYQNDDASHTSPFPRSYTSPFPCSHTSPFAARSRDNTTGEHF
jgi:hypothetical protein